MAMIPIKISSIGAIKTDIKWNFLAKDDDYKNQERLVIYPKGSSNDTVWEIRELRHNKIRLKRQVMNIADSIAYTVTLEPK